MSTKQTLKRAKETLVRHQRNLKVESLAIEKRRRELEDERTAVLLSLRGLCGRYGDNDWADETPLREIVDEHLAAGLAELVQRLRIENNRLARQLIELAEAAYGPAPSPEQLATGRPVPDGPTLQPRGRRRRALPEPPSRPAHATLVVLSQDRSHGAVGHRASCLCGHRTQLREHPAEAEADGRAHCEAANQSSADGSATGEGRSHAPC